MQATHNKTTNRAGLRALAGYPTALLIGLSVAAPLHAADPDLEAVKVSLVDAKLTGICGVMQQMAAFQETTQMAGGDKFIIRFWNTEFARLGLSAEDFLQVCLRVTSRHTELMQNLEEPEK